MKNEERHQWCFSFMRCDTGGQKTKTFWGIGNEEDSLKSCQQQAQQYARSYQAELDEKARAKARARGDYPPSPIKVQIVGRSMWK